MSANAPIVHDVTPADEGPATDESIEVPAEATAAAPAYERVDLDRYAVLHEGTVGYVESVPPVFVCYSGHPYAQAEEIAQVHDFHQAVEVVVEHAVSVGHPKLSA
ncbi:hypothetical protein [Microbacterium sp. 179-I 3D4 NHS]|uniref:hypothetical protein n=1 Tax=Microbacterium sp. 179-I 3D4 NHS TaxID=3142381 RepID=UPI00399FD260